MTRNELYQIANRGVLAIPYGDAQNLIRGLPQIGANCGVYGWNWSAYLIDGFVICNGYRSLTGKRANSELLKKADEKAKKVNELFLRTNLDYQKAKKKIEKIWVKYLEKEFN